MAVEELAQQEEAGGEWRVVEEEVLKEGGEVRTKEREVAWAEAGERRNWVGVEREAGTC